ncbi:MAG: CU044_5270 family protein [Umezawaea sp.]
MNTEQAPGECSDLDLLRVVLPSEALSDEGLARLRANTLRSLEAGNGRELPRHRRVLLVAAAAAVITGLGVGVVVLPRGDTPAPGALGSTSAVSTPGPLVAADTPARETLVALAAHTADLQPLTIRPDQFVYLHVRGQGVNGIALGEVDDEARVISESESETWFASDGLRVVALKRITDINARPLTEEDARKLAENGKKVPAQLTLALPDPNANGNPKLELPQDQSTEPGVSNPTLAWVAGLPTDPQQLLAVFQAEAGTNSKHDNDYLTFKTVVSFATSADALLTPQARSTLYQAIALLPGIERVPGQVDLAGRVGVAIGRTAEGMRNEIILDPVSSRVIGSRRVAVDLPGVSAGTVMSWSTNDQVVVDRAGATS